MAEHQRRRRRVRQHKAGRAGGDKKRGGAGTPPDDAAARQYRADAPEPPRSSVPGRDATRDVRGVPDEPPRRRRRGRPEPVPEPPRPRARPVPAPPPPHEPAGPPVGVGAEAPPPRHRQRHDGDHPGDGERGLRGLVGAGASQVSVSAALRARDAARPTEEDLRAAERDLTIVRRHWVPRDGQG